MPAYNPREVYVSTKYQKLQCIVQDFPVITQGVEKWRLVLGDCHRTAYLLTLIIPATNTSPSGATDGINLIDKDNAGSILLGL